MKCSLLVGARDILFEPLSLCCISHVMFGWLKAANFLNFNHGTVVDGVSLYSLMCADLHHHVVDFVLLFYSRVFWTKWQTVPHASLVKFVTISCWKQSSDNKHKLWLVMVCFTINGILISYISGIWLPLIRPVPKCLAIPEDETSLAAVSGLRWMSSVPFIGFVGFRVPAVFVPMHKAYFG